MRVGNLVAELNRAFIDTPFRSKDPLGALVLAHVQKNWNKNSELQMFHIVSCLSTDILYVKRISFYNSSNLPNLKRETAANSEVPTDGRWTERVREKTITKEATHRDGLPAREVLRLGGRTQTSRNKPVPRSLWHWQRYLKEDGCVSLGRRETKLVTNFSFQIDLVRPDVDREVLLGQPARRHLWDPNPLPRRHRGGRSANVG